MKNDPGSKFVRLSFLTLFLVFSAYGIFQYDSFSTSQAKQFVLHYNSFIQLSSPLIKQAIQSKDDISLIFCIQNIMQDKTVISAMAADSEGRVLAHSRASEIGAVKSSIKDIIKNNPGKLNGFIDYEGLKKSFYSVIKIAGRDYFFEIIVSSMEMEKQLNEYAVKTIFSCAAGFVLCFSLILFLSKRCFPSLSEIDNLKNTLTVSLQEKSGIEKDRDLFKARLEYLSASLGKMLGGFCSGVILTDYNNKIIYYDEKAEKFLYNKSIKLGHEHVYESITNIELMELLKKSVKNPNAAVEEHIKSLDRSVRVVSIKDNEEFVGTAILFL